MFDNDTLIIYGSTGVCRVCGVGPMAGSHGADRGRLYYKLLPVYGSGVIYVPVDTKIYMRPILTREEALDLIHKIPEIQDSYEDAVPDSRAMAETYHASLKSHNCEELVHLIKALYLKHQESAQSGKRPYKVDQDYQKRAEGLLHSELASALGIDIEAVPGFIAEELKKIG